MDAQEQRLEVEAARADDDDLAVDDAARGERGGERGDEPGGSSGSSASRRGSAARPRRRRGTRSFGSRPTWARIATRRRRAGRRRPWTAWARAAGRRGDA